ncbi:peptidylprolyl isomerase [Maribacter sp. 2308TA10-17]|uniref:peptidylprolyl isomerase n=1 Tax=Maribacter sp. 2308TA10-17 TaxID=3386276 RepID=UPI0039BC61FF
MKKLSIALLLTLMIGCNPAIFKSKWTKEIAPESYFTRFETTKGSFDIEVKRKWSPKAADRFYQLVKYKYFDNGVFYRVVPEFVAQFGNSDTTTTKAWNKSKIPDEKVILGNEKGTLSFARGGKETRTTDLYINLQDNSRLDTLNYNDVVGFPAFGKVIQGMDVVTEIYSGYGGSSAQKTDVLYTDRKKYFEEFPKLDVIQKVYFINEK